ncbi:MAG: HAD family phosphatase, partial [Clostridia bacterium]|nr:HAD family phosphatase [Clostridia bacterium]
MKYTAYLFDFDGTLVDSMPCWSQKMLNILKKSGVDYPADVIRIITPLGDLGTARYFRDTLGVSMTEEAMLCEMDAYALPRYRDEIPLKAGVRDYLRRLAAQGISLNVLTASPHKMVDPCLKRLGVWELFDHVWSCDDFATTKADPNIYIRAVEQIGTRVDDTAFFDDNINAIKTAAQAGLFTV